MFDCFLTAIELARKGHWNLFVGRAFRMLGLHAALRSMTCRIKIPGEFLKQDLRIYLELGDWISDDICRYGQWEPVLSKAILAYARRGGILIDAGANLGYFSLLWAAANAANRVWAFEASPRVYPKLARNIQLNRLNSQIQSFQIALSDRNGISAFECGPHEQTGWGRLVVGSVADAANVEMARMDTLFATIPRIEVLKIDTEGADTLVLAGAEGLLREKRIGAVYFEQARDQMAAMGVNPGDAVRLLEDCGYEVSRLDDPRYDGEDGVTQWQALPR